MNPEFEWEKKDYLVGRGKNGEKPIIFRENKTLLKLLT
jgi:hypothetical protein